jgi:hypothetical protein
MRLNKKSLKREIFHSNWLLSILPEKHLTFLKPLRIAETGVAEKMFSHFIETGHYLDQNFGPTSFWL